MHYLSNHVIRLLSGVENRQTFPSSVWFNWCIHTFGLNRLSQPWRGGKREMKRVFEPLQWIPSDWQGGFIRPISSNSRSHSPLRGPLRHHLTQELTPAAGWRRATGSLISGWLRRRRSGRELWWLGVWSLWLFSVSLTAEEYCF